MRVDTHTGYDELPNYDTQQEMQKENTYHKCRLTKERFMTKRTKKKENKIDLQAKERF